METTTFESAKARLLVASTDGTCIEDGYTGYFTVWEHGGLYFLRHWADCDDSQKWDKFFTIEISAEYCAAYRDNSDQGNRGLSTAIDGAPAILVETYTYDLAGTKETKEFILAKDFPKDWRPVTD